MLTCSTSHVRIVGDRPQHGALQQARYLHQHRPKSARAIRTPHTDPTRLDLHSHIHECHEVSRLWHGPGFVREERLCSRSRSPARLGEGKAVCSDETRAEQSSCVQVSMCAFTVETDRARFARERGGAVTASFRLVSARFLCKGKQQGKREMGGGQTAAWPGSHMGRAPSAMSSIVLFPES